ncbi:MAG TPA: proline dehydrogenase family protein [Gemmatimonadaceae bacterium]|nr:proline dehydrogenase family protein [Gemmatimonadaceae bacterium]
MSLSRSVLLRASRSSWLASQMRERAFARRAVRRFMPGERAADALDAAVALGGQGIGAVLTSLGERVATAAEADAVCAHYRELLELVRARGVSAHVSVKLTHLGFDLDADACLCRLRTLAEHAHAVGTWLWVDMEESGYVDTTLGLYRRLRAEWEHVGVCLQAYLRRTPADLEALLPLGAAVRLVKGAYEEPPAVAFARKRDTDAAYLELAERLLVAARGGGVLPVFGTHDVALLERIRARALALGCAPNAYEVHMLYGIKTAEQRALASRGVPVRVLISYGRHWFPWYMRRLAERPANVWFVVRQLVG